MSLVSQIRSLLEKLNGKIDKFQRIWTTNKDLREVFDEVKSFEKDVEKVLAPLMAHLQDFPTQIVIKGELFSSPTIHDFMVWKEELDKRRAHPENYFVESKEEMKQFCKDVLQLQAGIGLFNVEKEDNRAFKFIEKHFPKLLRCSKEESENK